MSAQIDRLQEQHDAAINEQERLAEALKDAYMSFLASNGGLKIKRTLFAGFIAYALDPQNKSSQFLKELEELGLKRFPSKKHVNNETKTSNGKNKVPRDTNQKAEAHDEKR